MFALAEGVLLLLLEVLPDGSLLSASASAFVSATSLP